MIEVRNISKSYGELVAVNQVSFKVEKGKVVGFLGANGAGKSTTMDIICGCIGADEGNVFIDGVDITLEPIKAKEKIGYLPDVPPLYLDMTVYDAIKYSAKLHNIKTSELNHNISNILEKLNLFEVKNRIIGNLSKGFRQRVAFAQAIVHKPSVLVLDEPTEGLDPNQIIQMRMLINQLKGDHTIILSSHILSEVQNVCDEILIIHQGRIVRSGTYEQLLIDANVDQCFKVRTKRPIEVLQDKLKNIPGTRFESLNIADSSMIIFASNEVQDFPDLIAKIILEHELGLLEISNKSRSLEDIFFQVTH